jgi:two-component system, response regulator
VIKILLVEDNPTDEKLTLRALAKSDLAIRVDIARDGAEALDYFFGPAGSEALARPPALVLLDLKLPKVGGLDVLRGLRQDPRTALIPVVVLTASNEETDVVESYKHGANAYIRKPVNFSEFVEAAKITLEFWLRLNERAPAGREEL